MNTILHRDYFVGIARQLDTLLGYIDNSIMTISISALVDRAITSITDLELSEVKPS